MVTRRTIRLTERREPALNAIDEHKILTLNRKLRKIFVEALLNPPAPNKKALSAAIV